MSAVPSGFGVYLSRATREWKPQEAIDHAERVKRSRITHVALCVEATDGWTATPRKLRSVASVYREIGGVAVSVYALPGSERVKTPTRVTAGLLDAAHEIEAWSAILDAEEAFRGHRVELTHARDSLTLGATEALSLGVTTYGLPSVGGSYPWEAISGWGWLGWQCYETSASRRKVRAGLAELRARWSRSCVVPHLASYARRTAVEGEPLDGADRLAGDLRRTCLDDSGACDVSSVWIWQDATLDHEECAVLAEWAQRLAPLT